MLKIEIPGQEDLTVKNIVFDYNLRSGTESEPSYTTFFEEDLVRFYEEKGFKKFAVG